MAENNIQQIIDSGTGVIMLPPGEYKGPFYIGHPCVIEGNSTTLWNCGDSVLITDSDGITLKNLRIEMIDDTDNCFSVCTSHPVITENTEIIGLTSGFGDEDRCPEMQKQLKLGNFRADENNTFLFDIYSPGHSVLETDMQDVIIEPTELVSGVNRVKITTGKIPAGTFIYGDLIMKSSFNRRFYIQGMSDEKSELINDRMISVLNSELLMSSENKQPVSSEYIQKYRSTPSCSEAGQMPQKNAASSVQKKAPDITSAPENSTVRILTRGERISINEYISKPFRVCMSYRALMNQVDIDPYAFMLNENGVTSCDDDFVFFGNRETMSGTLTFLEDKSIEIDLSRVPDHIKRISFVYSIYQPGPNDNFSKVKDPFISILQDNKEIIRFTAYDLFAETTVIFMEIYRHKSEWKINSIGQGYKEGLKRLCANYGLIVT